MALVFNAPEAALELLLNDPVIGSQLFVADILDSNNMPYLDLNGSPLEVTFTALGDSTNPELSVESQFIDPSNLYGLNISRVLVPERFNLGVWIAVYEDDNGMVGTYRGKEKFLPGEHLDRLLTANTRFFRAQRLHVLMRTPRPGSGSWDSSGEIVQTLSNINVTTEFYLDGVPYQAVLEVEDQEVAPQNIGFSEIVIKSATIPREYLGGGWVGIYDDNAGSPGVFIGNLKFPNGNKVDRFLTLNVNIQGDQTLHAKIFGGQLWSNAQNNPLEAQNGGDIVVSFRIGAQSLSYVDAAPYTTDDPRHVVVRRAYSFDNTAWVTVSR